MNEAMNQMQEFPDVPDMFPEEENYEENWPEDWYEEPENDECKDDR